jgi:ABC-type glycerol-3-phosphate transport system substrate-binding protein
MKQDLGFDPTPSDGSTWEQFYKTSSWFKKNAQKDVPYGHGHQAKQHDSLMNDFSNVLWAYGGDYFKDGVNVGRLGSLDPGEPILDSHEAVEAADFYNRLVSIAHPGRLGWDWDGLGAAFAAGQMAMAATGTSSRPATRPASSREQGRRRHPDARLGLQAARSPEGEEAALEDAQHPHGRRRLRGLEAGEHRAAAQDRGLE